MPQAGIFINYRRADTEGFAGRLEGDLVSRFGDARVFRDIEILPGQDWILEIERAIGASGAFLVLIGPHWLERDAQGKRRLDEPTDTLGREIEAALERDLVVIPVLVGGATMPAEADLPQPLRPLVRLNAAYLTPQGWRDDIDRLVGVLEQSIGPGTRRASSVAKPLAAVIVVAILAAAGFLIVKAATKNGPTTTSDLVVPTPSGGADGGSTFIAPPAPGISSVTFTGDVEDPTVTISGSGFGDDPPSAPRSANSTSCGDFTANGDWYGPFGSDSLWIQDQTNQWIAGVDDACIGLRVTSWSSTQVVFKFGNAYHTYCHPNCWNLNEGDRYTVHVARFEKIGSVHY